MAGLKRDDLILLIGGLGILSALFAFVQGWLGMQLQYMLILVAAIGIITALLHRKENVTIDVGKAYDSCMPMMKKFGYATESGAKLARAFKVSDNKRFSSYGKVWDMEFKSSPGRVAMLVDAKLGKVVGIDLEAPPRESPIQAGWKEPTYTYQPPRMKRKIEEEVRPG